MPNYWTLAMESWRLWTEASAVMWLRSLRLARGGALGEREARRMIEEKVDANMLLGLALLPSLLTGASPEALARRSMGHYGKRVRANRRRLAQAKR